MAGMLLFFLLITEFSISTAQQKTNSQISLGSSLSPNTNKSLWLSNSGQFAFGFYQQGNDFAVCIWFDKIEQKTVIWTANRDNLPLPHDVTLVLNGDGRLVLQDTRGVEILVVAETSQPAASASMLDSGNFVLYNTDSEIIWQSFDSPTDTLLSGQSLLEGKMLVSSVSKGNHTSGKFQLAMQDDGNLVQYPRISDLKPYHAYWNSQTHVRNGQNVCLILDHNGQLYLVDSTDFIIKNITGALRRHPGENVMYRLTLDVDGLLRLYSHSLVQNSSWNIEWNSASYKCAPVGLCGFNSYCVLKGEEPNCVCLPGFDYIDQQDKSLGCDRDSRIDACTIRNNDTVSVQELNGVMWESNNYSVVPTNFKTDCEEDCLSDCNCEIATFMDQKCIKQKFALGYSKAQPQIPVTSIIKVRNGSSTTSTGKANKGQRTSITSKEIKKGQRFLISGLVCITFAFIILLFSVFLFCRSRFPSNKNVGSQGILRVDEIFTLRSFTFAELEIATNGFIEQLGRGSFGRVFKGTLSFPNGQRAIAVKRLEKVATEGEVEFQNEMRSIGRIHHRNLLRMLGYCHEGSNILLVYDYMSNGSLAHFLFKSEMRPKWEERVRIALDIARGILYLHEECDNKIIHCDINPNNILIDENHSAKIADFGLAKLLMPDQTRTNTGIRGTRGFVGPEWHKNLPITAKADVYSFGVVLLVIVCCRPSVDSSVPEKEAILVDWIYECCRANKVRNLMQDEVEEQEFDKMVKIGLWCIEEEPTIRPTMKEVVAMFEGTLDIAVPPTLASCGSASSYLLDI